MKMKREVGLVVILLTFCLIALIGCGGTGTTETTAAGTETTAAGTETTAAGTETTAAGTETTAASTETTAAASGEPIKIGLLAELTGFLANLGIPGEQGVELAVEQLGNVAGRPVELIIEDIASDVTTTMDKARKLVEQDKVDIIIGPIFTAAADALAPYVQRMNVPAVSISAHDFGIIEFQSIWLQTAVCAQQTYAMGQYAYNVLGYKTANTIASDYNAGWEYIEGFKRGFEDAGGKVIQEQLVSMDTADISPYYAKLADADCLALAPIGGHLIPSVAQAKQTGVMDRMKVIMATDLGLTDPPNLKEAGDAAIGTVAEAHYNSSAPTPGNKEFVAAFETKYGQLPASYAGMAYAAYQIVYAALTATNGDTSYDKLAAALDATNIDTVRGHITFDARRVGNTESRIVEFKGWQGETYVIETLATYQNTAATKNADGTWTLSTKLVQ
jgi:branched-chain amino acid transport system substrate-binding protein